MTKTAHIKLKRRNKRAQAMVLVLCVLLASVTVSLKGLLRGFREGAKVRQLDKQLKSQQLLLPEEAIPGFSSDAVVLLAYFGRQQEGLITEWAKIGFVVGDGQLILTAAHCVDTLNDLRSQAVSSELVAISPYYGDVFKVELVAVDEHADLAVLKAHWPGHPALSLADPNEIKNADRMFVAGYRQEEDKEPPYRYHSDLSMERLTVRRLDETVPDSAITLQHTRYIRPGWSGSAIVLPKSGAVAGVCNKISISKTKKGKLTRRDAAGCSVASINALLSKHGLLAHIQRPPGGFETVQQSPQAFSLIVDYLMSFWNRDIEASLAIAKRLVQARSGSPYLKQFLAWSAENAFHRDPSREDLLRLAESSYKQALALDDDNASLHSAYGNFLTLNKRFDEAIIEVETALSLDASDDLALINRLNILNAKDPAKAAAYGQELVEKYPDNYHYWFWHADAMMKLKRYEEALHAAQKAVDLNPDGLYYGRLADALVKNDQLDRAEECYRKMTAACKCQRCWNNLARFLISRGSEYFDDAADALDKSAKSNPRSNTERNLGILRINLNLDRLRHLEKQSPEEARTRCRKLLEETPDNGHYWFALAGILRTLDNIDEALIAARRAVELEPDRSYKPRLANILAKAGKLEEARTIYDDLLENHPDRDKYKLWYAQYLADYFPDKTEEVRRIIENLKPGKNPWQVSEQELEDLKKKIHSTP
jgi:tetratricopeptide (TPR) repeat protein